MFELALSDAAQTTIAYIAIWVVFVPGIVMGLIIFAIIQARGEKEDYEQMRRSRRR